MSFDPASSIVTPAHTAFRGVTHFPQGPILERRIRPTERHKLAHTAREIAHVANIGHRVTVPILAPFADLVPILQMWQATPFGRSIAPQAIKITSVDSAEDGGTNVITLPVDALATADAVNFLWDETAPTLSSGSLVKTTTYYVYRTGTATYTLHTTALDAADGSNPIVFSTDGVGPLWLTHEFPLTVARRTDIARTYLNAAVLELPQLIFAAGQLVWSGNIVFGCYPKKGGAASDGDAAFFTEAGLTYSLPTWDPTSTLTSVATTVAWGASAPWSALESDTPWTMTLKPGVTEQRTNAWPVAGVRLTSFEAMLKGTPLGITQSEFDAVFAEVLGGQVVRAGAAGTDLVVTIAGYTITLRDALLLEEVDVQRDVTAKNIGEMTWTALGDANSDQNPPFVVAAV